MLYKSLAASLVVLCLVVSSHAQSLRFQTGQVLHYRIEHSTSNTETMADTKATTKNLLKLTKRWQVLGVDKDGIATLQLSLTALAQERTTYSGDVLKYDSAAPEKSTPQLREVFGKFLNTPLATIRVDKTGKVIEVKEAKSDASGFESELPFLGVLPLVPVRVGSTWERAYKITLNPPLGTGQKYDAVQKFACKELKGDLMTVSMVTELKNGPKAEADQIPLWQMLPVGTLVYDQKNGRLEKAELVIEKETKGHQGEGSSCKFVSKYTLQWVEK